jgi:hypothetical protein
MPGDFVPPRPPGIFWGMERNDSPAGDTMRERPVVTASPDPTPSRRSFPVIPGRVASPHCPLAFGRKALAL